MLQNLLKALDNRLPVGPRSVLFGAHCWFIHPWFVALAWHKLYGFPTDPRLWVAFFVHDLGYLFQWCSNMDGPEGEEHVHFGANLMHRWFDKPRGYQMGRGMQHDGDGEWEDGYWEDIPVDEPLRHDFQIRQVGCVRRWFRPTKWRNFCLYHSRFYAKKDGKPFSRLCVADKLACCLEPWWLYIPRVWLSGEVWEYLTLARGKSNSKYETMRVESGSIRAWHRSMTTYLRQWVEEHRDGRDDTWTPAAPVEEGATS